MAFSSMHVSEEHLSLKYMQVPGCTYIIQPMNDKATKSQEQCKTQGAGQDFVSATNLIRLVYPPILPRSEIRDAPTVMLRISEVASRYPTKVGWKHPHNA